MVGAAIRRFRNIVFDAYVSEANQSAGREVNEQAMVDFRAKVPRIPYLVPFPAGMQLYGELGTEDKWSELPIPSRAAILAGIYIPQVFPNDTLDLRIEFADTDLSRQRHPELTRVWYNNGDLHERHALSWICTWAPYGYRRNRFFHANHPISD